MFKVGLNINSYKIELFHQSLSLDEEDAEVRLRAEQIRLEAEYERREREREARLKALTNAELAKAAKLQVN